MIALVLLALVGYAACDTTCLKGWEQGSKSCYKVIDYRTDWVTAYMYCAAMRAQLADIESQEEQDEVAAILGKYKDLFEQFWIDLSDIEVEGQFKWMAFNQNATYTNWIPGQPDNNAGKPAENCVHINAKPFRKFGWNDHKCGAQLNFICEAFPEENTISG
ncbi:perlucin-like [Gigantopelta aegis]|uniref:perlucin-like n=1 Tax=Gigantopelta aegis TaxID=1735272 RepID=UPI001B88C3F1|nr:perlucin-like [Gigantopelta aegis]